MTHEAETEDEDASGVDRMSEEDFQSAREEFEFGRSGVVDLADKYGVTRQAISRRFKRIGAIKGSRAHELVTPASSGASQPAPEPVVERFSARRSDWIEETRVTGYNALKQAQMIARRTMLEALKAKKLPSAIDDDMRAIQRFNKILCDNVSATLSLLNADDNIDDDDLPILTIEDLTDEEVLQHHKNTGAFDENTTVEEMLAEKFEFEIGDLE